VDQRTEFESVLGAPEEVMIFSDSAGVPADGMPADHEILPPMRRRKEGGALARLVELVRNAFSGKEISQGFFSLADQAVASITNFATGVILARCCTKEEFGLYMLGFTVILLATDIQTSLIATPYMVYAPRLQGARHALYSGSTLVHQVVFSLITMLILAIGAFVTHFGIGPNGLPRVIGALSIVIAVIMSREFVRRICFARLKLKTAFVFDACVGVAQIGGLLLIARLGWLSANSAYWVIGAACGAGVIWWLWTDRNYYRPRAGASIADLKRNWTFGKWVFASGLLWTASTNLYPWLLAFFHGAAAAGTFAACMGVVSASNPVLLGIQNLVGPKIAHEYAQNGPTALRRLVLRISGIIALPVSLLTVVLIVWGDRLIGMLYGHQYTGNRPVVAVLACNLLVTALAFAFSRALFAVERADLDFRLNLAAIAIMATLGLWLVRVYGPLGAALGLLTAIVLTSAVRAAVFLMLPARELVHRGGK
jgi:O-antigen/teichoic acid export membrane protein